MTAHPTQFVESQSAGLQIDLDTLEHMASWREDLSKKLARAQLTLALHDSNLDFSELAAVKSFKRKSLPWPYVEARCMSEVTNAQLDAEVITLNSRRWRPQLTFTLYRDIETEPRKHWLVRNMTSLALANSLASSALQDRVNLASRVTSLRPLHPAARGWATHTARWRPLRGD